MSLGAETCYMCKAPATSREHVPPACLFPARSLSGQSFRRNLICVPSCDTHNSKKSKDDEFLRAYLVLCSAHVSCVAAHAFNGKLLRAVRRSPGTHGAFVEDSGVSGPDGTRVLRTDRGRFDRCIDHIARGIHFHSFGERLDRPTAVVSPNFFVSGADGRIAAHAHTEETVDVSRKYLQSMPVLGENPAVFATGSSATAGFSRSAPRSTSTLRCTLPPYLAWSQVPDNYLFKRTAVNMLRSFGPLLVSGRLTRPYCT